MSRLEEAAVVTESVRPVQFGEFVLRRADQTLFRGNVRVPLAPKAFALLDLLVRRARPGSLAPVVRKREILAQVWADTFVSDAVVKVCVRELRRALQDSAVEPRYIRSERGRGYRFIAECIEEPGCGSVLPEIGRVDLPRLAAGLDVGVETTLSERIQAGERAEASRSWQESANHYAAACTAAEFDGATDRPRLLELTLRRMSAARRAGDVATFRGAASRALALAEATRDPRMQARAVLELAEAHQSVTAPVQDLAARLEAVLRDLPNHELELRARVAARLAYARAAEAGAEADSGERRDRLLASAGRMAEESGSRAARAFVLKYALWARRGLDAPRLVLEQAERLVAWVEDSPSYESRLHATALCACAALELGDGRRFERWLERYVELAAASRQPMFGWSALRLRVLRAFLHDDLVAAERHIGEGVKLAESFEQPDAIALFYLQTLTLRLLQGRYAEIASALERAAAIVATTPAWRALRVYAYACAGESSRARRELRELAAQEFAAIPRDGAWKGACVLLADACVVLREREAARSLYALLLPHRGELAVVHAAVCYGSIERPLGELALLLRRPVAARRHLEAALHVHERIGAHGWERATRAALRRHAAASQSARRVRPSARAEFGSVAVEPLAGLAAEPAGRDVVS